MNTPITILSKGGTSIVGYGSAARCERHVVESLVDVRTVLERLRDRPSAGPRLLDLVGHSRRATKLLVLGRDVVDPFIPTVERFFSQLTHDHVLDDLGVVGVRLIGCETVVLPIGQRAIRRLARLLDMPVFGSRKPISNAHFGEHGLDPCFDHLLIGSDSLPDHPHRFPLVR